MKKQFFKKPEVDLHPDTQEIDLHPDTQEVRLHTDTQEADLQLELDVSESTPKIVTSIKTYTIEIKNDITRIMNGPGNLFTWTGKYAKPGKYTTQTKMEDTDWYKIDTGWVYCA